jgi:hypothetical protein
VRLGPRIEGDPAEDDGRDIRGPVQDGREAALGEGGHRRHLHRPHQADHRSQKMEAATKLLADLNIMDLK